MDLWDIVLDVSYVVVPKKYEGAKLRYGLASCANAVPVSDIKCAVRSRWSEVGKGTDLTATSVSFVSTAPEDKTLVLPSPGPSCKYIVLVVEKNATFSNQTLVGVFVELHEIVYAGSLAGPFQSPDQQWKVFGTLRVREKNKPGVVLSPTPSNGNHNLVSPPNTSSTPLRSPTDVLGETKPFSSTANSVTAASFGVPPPSSPWKVRSPSLVSPALGPSAPGLNASFVKDFTIGTDAGVPLDDGSANRRGVQLAEQDGSIKLCQVFLPETIAKSLMEFGYPPVELVKVYARPQLRSLPSDNRSQRRKTRQILQDSLDVTDPRPKSPPPTVSSRLAAVVLVPGRTTTIAEDDLAMILDTYSVELGESIVLTVGANATVKSTRWRPEVASQLNEAAACFGSNTCADAGTQTGDVSQLLSVGYAPSEHASVWGAREAEEREKFENAEAFQKARGLIAQAERREAIAVAEATRLRQAVQKLNAELEEMKRKHQLSHSARARAPSALDAGSGVDEDNHHHQQDSVVSSKPKKNFWEVFLPDDTVDLIQAARTFDDEPQNNRSLMYGDRQLPLQRPTQYRGFTDPNYGVVRREPEVDRTRKTTMAVKRRTPSSKLSPRDDDVDL